MASFTESEINSDKESPQTRKEDIDRFFNLGGASLLTLRTPDNNIPYAAIENGIAGEIHVEWTREYQEAFLSVWKGCETATLVTKTYGDNQNTRVHNFSLSEDKDMERIKTEVEKFFNYIQSEIE